MIEDTPPELVHDLFTQAVFGDHPLGRPVLGSAEVILPVTRRSIGAFHRARYRPTTSSSRPRAGRPRRARRSRPGFAEQRAGARSGSPCRGRPSWPRRRRRCASSARRRSSTTCASARPGSRGSWTGGASRPRSWTGSPGGSASSRLFQEIRRSGPRVRRLHLHVPVRGHGQVGVYVGTREDNLGECPTWSRTSWLRWPPGTCARTRSNGRRRTSRGGSCSRLRADSSNRMSRPGRSP